LPHPSGNAEQQLQEREFAATVNAQLQLLSPIERTILVLYHQEECSLHVANPRRGWWLNAWCLRNLPVCLLASRYGSGDRDRCRAS
jgi:hypothetical protein